MTPFNMVVAVKFANITSGLHNFLRAVHLIHKRSWRICHFDSPRMFSYCYVDNLFCVTRQIRRVISHVNSWLGKSLYRYPVFDVSTFSLPIRWYTCVSYKSVATKNKVMRKIGKKVYNTGRNILVIHLGYSTWTEDSFWWSLVSLLFEIFIGLLLSKQQITKPGSVKVKPLTKQTIIADADNVPIIRPE